LLHRDLSNPKHKTNLHLHYDISYPENGKSFFTSSPPDILLEPKDPKVHKKLEMKQVFDKKLRWMTLGGQYDWTKKVYPAEMPPDFPKDIADLVHGICPWMEPQAAITNVYSPGDTLSLHRDVSEEVNAGLVSISLGCDCLFMIGVEDNSSEQGCRYNTIRLHSGDVLFMEGPARFAWHGVPKIIPDSCPSDLSDWPNDSTSSGPGPFPQWQGWMKNKRINLNVRQMREN
jgi:DNA alkylation damage repair protein AlkB